MAMQDKLLKTPCPRRMHKGLIWGRKRVLLAVASSLFASKSDEKVRSLSLPCLCPLGPVGWVQEMYALTISYKAIISRSDILQRINARLCLIEDT